MNDRAIDVLVVDDSALMRRQIRMILEEAGGFSVRAARDGEDALAKLRDQRADVVSLDINMPVMDGLTCLAHIMEEVPCPVVMLSSLTEKGAVATFEAMAMGAVDYVGKPGGTVSHDLARVSRELVRKLRTAASATVRGGASGTEPEPASRAPVRVVPRPDRPRPAPSPSRTASSGRAGRGIVLMGASTGGPATVETVLTRLDRRFSRPVALAQHMPAAFTRAFAARLDAACSLTVLEVERPTPVESGYIYIAHGDHDLIFERRLSRVVAVPVDPSDAYIWHPSVDRMVESAMDHFDPAESAAVLLTGMGDDGASAMTELQSRGALTIAESPSSAIVYGMPRALVEKGGAARVLDCARIANHLNVWARGSSTSGANDESHIA